MLLVIITICNQQNNITKILEGFNQQKVKPDHILFVLDRCEYSEYVNTNLNISFFKKSYGNGFNAGLARDTGLIHWEKLHDIENVLFVDGDCVPNSNVVEQHLINLNQPEPVLSIGRRLKCGFDERDGYEIFHDQTSNHIFEKRFFGKHINISLSCNFALNYEAIKLCRIVNKENRVFNSSFDGEWGLEDSLVGSIIHKFGRVYTCNKNSYVTHIDHKSNEVWTNRRKYLNLLKYVRNLDHDWVKSQYNGTFLEYIKQNSLVFDIGANKGQSAKKFLNLNKNLKIVSVEPQDCFDESLPVTFVKSALSSDGRLLDFFMSSEHPDLSTSSILRVKSDIYKYTNYDKFATIESITINDLINKYGIPDYCKIDCEGSDMDILSTLSFTIPFISFEHVYEIKDNTLMIIEKLSQFGNYLYNFSIQEDDHLRFHSFINKEQFIKWLETKDIPYFYGNVHAIIESQL